MKILFSLLLLLAMATQALAQGKVRLVNDSLHLVYWDPNPADLPPGEAALAGQPYRLGDAGQPLTIELWSGTSSTALSRVAVTDFTGQPGPGVWLGMNVTLPTGPGATFFAIDILDPLDVRLYGSSGVFTTVSSSTIAYNSLVNHNSPALSTFADGTYGMDFLSPGYRGAIELIYFPEPSLTGLSAVALALVVLRRRAEMRKCQKGN